MIQSPHLEDFSCTFRRCRTWMIRVIIMHWSAINAVSHWTPAWKLCILTVAVLPMKLAWRRPPAPATGRSSFGSPRVGPRAAPERSAGSYPRAGSPGCCGSCRSGGYWSARCWRAERIPQPGSPRDGHPGLTRNERHLRVKEKEFTLFFSKSLWTGCNSPFPYAQSSLSRCRTFW